MGLLSFRKFCSIILGITLLFGSLVLANPRSAIRDPQSAIRLEPSKKAWEWADKTLKNMSVDEKVGQLVHVGVNARFAHQDSFFFKDLRRHVTENKIGGIIFFGAPIYETTHLINRMQEAARIPLLMSLDAETGIGMRFQDATNFPWAMAVTATGKPEFARRMGVITGREARAIGIQHVYAPVLDVNNNADNPVINVRSFGEDPEDVARFGIAFAEGLQSQKVIATAKHFPGHGDTNVDSHRGLPIIDLPRERLTSLELVPFKRAVDAGIGSIMIAHIALPQIDGEEIRPLKEYQGGDAEPGTEIVSEKATVPATLSYKVQTEMLRNEMGFKGLIVSDAMSMSGLTLYFTQEEAGVRAFLAGTDILEKPADVDAMLRGLKTAVASGRIPMQRLDESVRRQLAWKYEVGLTKQKITPLDQIDRIVSGPESTKLTDEIAEKAITLVRQESGVLPLIRDAKIAVLGISNGFDGPSTMAPFAGAMRVGGLRFSQAYLQENSLAEQSEAARKTVNEADVIIVGLYGRVRSGAANSVGIPENGAAILREALASNKKVIGISFGNPYILSSFPEMKTYLVAYGDMPSLQRAAAKGLLGQQGFTGKLPITLPGLHPRGAGIQITK
ncbi:MAG TPA: glycoside hydrolase family 3 N-terminal domain-containing protein [Pyrinomonadaceae bacterium]|nr:glycoside hydrolase family 3 N-terminal domain-containing protein [Pyrinomonadaceae bacterium]HMP65972.1 glycoside hydrolase family 3 N-terminal domain-containing protein [Pyrinomonadaceae bacterium]